MIILPKNCRIGKMTVHPKNWESAKADVSINWYISYRFYDPNVPKPKLVLIRSMNKYPDREDRQEVTRALIENEIKNLTEFEYNPIANTMLEKRPAFSHIQTFLEALDFGFSQLQVAPKTKQVIGFSVEVMKKAAVDVGVAYVKISEIRRVQIKLLLSHLLATRPKFSASTYNHYRAYLVMIFSQLEEVELVAGNPVTGIKKLKITKKKPRLLTPDERKIIDAHLSKVDPRFNRFIHLFFHSGARLSEMVRLQVKDIDLQRLQLKVLIKKGAYHKEDFKPIKKIAVPLWEQIIKDVSRESYIFSLGLEPGVRQISTAEITRRWKKFVIVGLDIPVGLNKLRHLNTTQVSRILGSEDAARLNSHTTTAMVQQVYDVDFEDVQMERIRNLSNAFVPEILP